MKKYNICICGGGNLGHVVASVLSNYGHNISILTSKPDLWNNQIILQEDGKDDIVCKISNISSNPEDVVSDADIIIFTLAGEYNEMYLKKIKDYIRPDVVVGTVFGSVGFYWIAKYILPESVGVFSFQRVPFIARVTEYGVSSHLRGRRDCLYIYTSDNCRWVIDILKDSFSTDIKLLSSPLSTILTNSNSLLHTSRMFTLFNGCEDSVFSENIKLYSSWNDAASELYISADNELQILIEKLGIPKLEIPDVLTYYESTDIKSLTRKITSIISLKGINIPMNKVGKGYIMDKTSRLFEEDIPYGILLIKSVTLLLNIDTPNIDKIIYWAQKILNKSYLVDGELNGVDVKDSGVSSNYGIYSIEDLKKLY